MAPGLLKWRAICCRIRLPMLNIQIWLIYLDQMCLKLLPRSLVLLNPSMDMGGPQPHSPRSTFVSG